METSQIFVNLIDSFYLVFAISLIGKRAKANKLKYCITALAFFIYVTSITYFFPSFDGSKIEPYISVVYIIVLYMIIFKTSLFDSAFYFLFGFLVLVVFEMLMLAIMTVSGLPLESVINNTPLLSVFELIKLVFILFITRFNIFRKWTNKIQSLAPYFVTVILNIFIFMQFMRIITDRVVNGNTVSYQYVYILFFSMFLINALLIRYVIKSQRELTQIKSYADYEKMIIPLIENSRAIEHDFKNHLLTLKGLAGDKNTKEFNEYISSINQEIKENSTYKICTNPVMGALMQEKANYAKNNDIDFNIGISENEIENINIKSHHLIAVLSNLIDNAFEEVIKLNSENRHVSVNYKENKNVEISVINTLSKDSPLHLANMKNNQRFSTKGKSRGYGLNNIKKIVKKYDGELMMFHNTDSIEITILLNSQSVK